MPLPNPNASSWPITKHCSCPYSHSLLSSAAVAGTAIVLQGVYKIACDRGVRKYFAHAGALITADGTGDELIKLEGMPKNYKFTF